MDEDHLAAAFRYVALNPVRAGLVGAARDWQWSSARVHLGLARDDFTQVEPARRRFSNFAELLGGPLDAGATDRLRQGESIGRPVGSPAFLTALEAQTNRRLSALARGPKPGVGASSGERAQ